jgi:hypothetical protein
MGDIVDEPDQELTEEEIDAQLAALLAENEEPTGTEQVQNVTCMLCRPL